MQRRRLARYLLSPVFLLAVAPGCLSLSGSRPVTVLARDAETKQPIPGAEVRISYLVAQPGSAPNVPPGKTGGDGVARLQATPSGDAPILVRAAADGYMSEAHTLSAEALRAIAPAHRGEAADQRPVSVVLELYAEPRATIELVLPAGFHGVLKAEVKVKEDTPCVPGQRNFSYVVPASGVVHVTGPPLFQRGVPPEFCARYADGPVLTRDPKGPELGLWWLRSEGNCELFLVGTRGEYAGLRPAQEEGARARPSRGGGGGRGRRGRGGNQQTDDSNAPGTMP